ncbi:MAG TPA: hypothetical protein VMA83_00700 [Solirubrobacteraceae bacterium]|nr:hypothetical protein [Solirubrobacteraceae bacterium]
MLLVIFGAGASHDSGAPISGIQRPPLAEGLTGYHDVAAEFRMCLPVIDYVEGQMERHELALEFALAKFGELAAADPDRRRQLVAFRFYLCKAIREVTETWYRETSGLTRYLTLLSRLKTWQQETGEDIALVTFNYDELIERALEALVGEWHLWGPDDYVARTDWRLFKLHGSINWSRVGRRPLTVKGTESSVVGVSNLEGAMQAADQLEGDLPIVDESALDASVADPIAAGGIAPGGAVLFPALAVPVAGKHAFECPASHVSALKDALPDVTRVLICGWRAAELHMIELLDAVSKRPLRLAVVAGNDSDVAAIHGQLGDLSRYAQRAFDEPKGMTGLVKRLDDALPLLLAPFD